MNDIPKYRPNKKGKEILTRVMDAYNAGLDQLNTRIPAFSNKTAEQIYKESLNAYNIVREDIDKQLSPVDSWKANVKRPVVRTKVAAIISSFIKQLMIPSVKAVEDSVPKEKRAEVIKALLDYWRVQVKYDTKMREILIDAVASPYTMVETGYQKVFKNKRIWNNETGEFDVKQVVDDILTGFYMRRLKFGQILVASIEERDVQRQDWIIKRSINSYEHYRGLYGNKEDWKYVVPGKYFDHDSNDYIDTRREIGGEQVEEVVYYSRTRDEQITIINGVIIEDSTLTKKRINGDYPFARVGSEPLTDEYSWFSYPLILRLNEDQKLRNHLYNLLIDSEYMNMNRPKAVSQTLKADSFIPGAATTVGEDFKIHDLMGGGSSQLMSVIGMIEKDTEEIAPAHMSGVKPQGEMSRRQWVDLSENAFTSQGIFLAEIKDFVEDLTRLAINDLLQHLVVGAANRIVGGEIPASVIIRDGYHGDAAQDMSIQFVSPLASQEDPLERSFKILQKEKFDNTKIIEIDPNVLFNTEFDVFITPETLRANKEQDQFQKAQIGYNVFSQNPYVNLEFITKEFGKQVYGTKVNKLMKSKEQIRQEQEAVNNPQQEEKVIDDTPKQIGGDQNQPKIDVSAPFI